MFITLLNIKMKSLFYRMTVTKKGKKVKTSNLVLYAILFALLGLFLLTTVGFLYIGLYDAFNTFGLIWAFYLLAGVGSLSLCIVGSIFLVYHEMYDSKDNDLLLSMPIKPFNIIMSRLSMVVILNYLYEGVMFLPAYAIATYYGGFNLLSTIFFIIIFLSLPLLAITISCILAYLLSFFVRFFKKYINLISIILFIAGFGLYMWGVSELSSLATYLIANGKTIAESFRQYFYPLYHMSIAITEGNILSLLIYLACVLVPYLLVTLLISTSFVKTATISKGQSKAKGRISYKKNNIIVALIKIDLKHYTSNAMLFLNASMGAVFSLLALAYSIFKYDTIKTILDTIPLNNDMYVGIAVGIGIALSSMNIISASSISIEGSRFMLLKSLAIKEYDILKAKFLNHLLLTAPLILVISTICIVFKPLAILDILFIFITPILYVIMIDALGLIINLMKPRFDYLNDIACVKQSLSVTITLFTSMALVALYFWLWYKLGMNGGVIFNALALAVLFIIDITLLTVLRNWGTKRLRGISI